MIRFHLKFSVFNELIQNPVWVQRLARIVSPLGSFYFSLLPNQQISWQSAQSQGYSYFPTVSRVCEVQAWLPGPSALCNRKVAEWLSLYSAGAQSHTSTSVLCQVHSLISCCFSRLTAGFILNFHLHFLLIKQMALLSLVVAESGCFSRERYSGDNNLRFRDNV